jgi:hypothetical protein
VQDPKQRKIVEFFTHFFSSPKCSSVLSKNPYGLTAKHYHCHSATRFFPLID